MPGVRNDECTGFYGPVAHSLVNLK